MQVRFRLNASLRKYLPHGSADNCVELDLRDGSTLADALAALGIPAGHARIAVSGADQLDSQAVLYAGMEVSLFPPLAGGR